MKNWTSRANLYWETWENQWSCYQPASGETHFLNPLGAAILTHLESAPGTLNDLCERLAEDFDVAPADNLRAQVASTLARFDELGLIRRQPHDDTAA